MVKIENGFFGDIEISQDEIFTFEEGLLGFPGCREFAIFGLSEYQPFLGMQSLVDPDVGFVLVDPRLFIEDYKPVLTELELQKIGAQSISEVDVYSIVVLNSDVTKITANLLGPIFVNVTTKFAGQFVLAGQQDQNLLKYPLYPTSAPKAG